MFSSSISVDQTKNLTYDVDSLYKNSSEFLQPFCFPTSGWLFLDRHISSYTKESKTKLILLKQSCYNLPYVKQQKWILHKVIYPLLPSDGFPLHNWFVKNLILNPCGQRVHRSPGPLQLDLTRTANLFGHVA